MKRIVSLLLLVLLLSLSLCSCGGKGNRLEGNLKDIVADVTANYDFSGVKFVYSGTEEGTDMLYYSYGFDSEEGLTDYVLCERANGKAASFIIIRFGDGITAETIKNTLQTEYVEASYSNFQLYIPEQYEIDLGATYKIYDNAVVLVIYDTTGNTGVLSTVDKYAE